MYPTQLQTNDHELAQRIANFLLARNIEGLENVGINVTGGVVTLSGKLPTAHDKFLCVECCRHVAGVVRLNDKLKIRGDATQDGQPTRKRARLPRLPEPNQVAVAYSG